MTQYELLYIIPATLTDDDVSGIEGNVKTILEKYGATVDSVNRLGKLRLAYPIQNVRHGHYVLVRFTAERPQVAKIEENLRITPEVLRNLILRADEAGDEKFDLVQFTEVNVDAKMDERRAARKSERSEKSAEEIKSGVAALESKEGEEAKPAVAKEISDEEIDKRIDAALKEDNA
jgi:small subunit ribosomal protein S6